VDEALRVMYGMMPDWARFTPDHAKTLRLRALDTGHTWFVTLGRFTGSDPDGGSSYEELNIQAAAADPGLPVGAEVSGDAADLDCWLWHRPSLERLQRTGDPGILADFEAAIGPGIN